MPFDRLDRDPAQIQRESELCAVSQLRDAIRRQLMVSYVRITRAGALEIISLKEHLIASLTDFDRLATLLMYNEQPDE